MVEQTVDKMESSDSIVNSFIKAFVDPSLSDVAHASALASLSSIILQTKCTNNEGE